MLDDFCDIGNGFRMSYGETSDPMLWISHESSGLLFTFSLEGHKLRVFFDETDPGSPLVAIEREDDDVTVSMGGDLTTAQRIAEFLFTEVTCCTVPEIPLTAFEIPLATTAPSYGGKRDSKPQRKRKRRR